MHLAGGRLVEGLCAGGAWRGCVLVVCGGVVCWWCVEGEDIGVMIIGVMIIGVMIIGVMIILPHVTVHVGLCICLRTRMIPP